MTAAVTPRRVNPASWPRCDKAALCGEALRGVPEVIGAARETFSLRPASLALN